MATKRKEKKSETLNDYIQRYINEIENGTHTYFSNKGYSTNSIGKLAKTLKTIVRTSHEEKLHSNTEYQRKRFKTLKVDVTNVYLTQKEVDALYNFDFHKVPERDLSRKLIPEYELTRDVFLCGVWTAQRFSDYSRIKPEHIK